MRMKKTGDVDLIFYTRRMSICVHVFVLTHGFGSRLPELSLGAHEAIRTTFVNAFGDLQQCVLGNDSFQLIEVIAHEEHGSHQPVIENTTLHFTSWSSKNSITLDTSATNDFSAQLLRTLFKTIRSL